MPDCSLFRKRVQELNSCEYVFFAEEDFVEELTNSTASCCLSRAIFNNFISVRCPTHGFEVWHDDALVINSRKITV